MPDERLTDLEQQSAERVEREARRLFWRRWWVGALVLSALGYFGIKEVVRSATESEIRAAVKAAVLAEEKAKKAGEVTEEAAKLSAAYAKSVGVLQEQAGTVQAQFVALTQQVKAESANLKAGAENSRSASDIRLARLEELVERVARDAQTSRQAIEAYKSDIGKIKATAADEARQFGANSEYTVSILYFPQKRELAEKAQGILSKVGFKVATANIPLSLPQGGASVPSGDLIRYTEGAAHKAHEVRRLLSELVQFRAVEQIRSGLEYEKWSLVHLGGFTPSNRIVVYLSL